MSVPFLSTFLLLKVIMIMIKYGKTGENKIHNNYENKKDIKAKDKHTSNCKQRNRWYRQIQESLSNDGCLLTLTINFIRASSRSKWFFTLNCFWCPFLVYFEEKKMSYWKWFDVHLTVWMWSNSLTVYQRIVRIGGSIEEVRGKQWE